ncbi:MAG: hypothetical protein R3A47_08985 [Polyangiales bacterium]
MVLLNTELVSSAKPFGQSPASVSAEFKRLLLGGMTLHADGEAAADPVELLHLGYTPKFRVDLFDTRFYLTQPRQNPALRFFVAYVVQPRGKNIEAYARIFYKDLSLVWRCASHMIATGDDFWIGKGDVKCVRRGGYEYCDSLECTTDLPLEIQSSLEELNHSAGRVRVDDEALYLILKSAPENRIRPYNEFVRLRRRAESDRRNLINSGRSIAKFSRKNDPQSLKVVKGFEPNFKSGLLERERSRSTMYGGDVDRFRVLSKNKQIQYLFFKARTHAWIIPPQALTTELSSFGLRTINVHADEDLFVPGYEYHFFDENEDPSEHFSQIPKGYAGAPCPVDHSRADASAWLNKIPMIQEFKKAYR